MSETIKEEIKFDSQGFQIGTLEVGSPIHSYPKIFSLGHKQLADLFKGEVLVEEKVDGSQFSFGIVDGELFFRSRGATIYPETAQKLFKSAVEYVISIKDKLPNGFIFRGEVLHAPRHNTLTYGRVPKNNIVIFDVEMDRGQNFMVYNQKYFLAEQLGLETVPQFFKGEITNIDQLRALLETESFLGGVKLEGIVIKNYNQFGEDKKVLMGKWVREEFKEIHQGAWKGANPSRSDVIELMVKTYKNENRWDKAIQHMRDAGKLTNEPKDIGPLIREFQNDLVAECAAEIKDKLYEYALPKILRGASAGLAEYYKNKLAESQFATKELQNEQA